MQVEQVWELELECPIVIILKGSRDRGSLVHSGVVLDRGIALVYRRGVGSMYEHLVLFKFNDSLTPAKEQELLGRLKAFKGTIPGIVELTAGINVTDEKERVQGYTLGLRVTFESHSALSAYGPHPVHQGFVRSLDGVIEDVIVVDYPFVLTEPRNMYGHTG